MNTKAMLELTVTDRPGVLDRIVGLIRRRGINIDSLTAGDIGGGETQITMRVSGRGLGFEALGEQFDDMDAVHSWRLLSQAQGVLRELLMFRLPEGTAHTLGEVVRVVHRAQGMLYCEVTAAPSEVDEMVSTLQAAGIACVRSGPMAFLQDLAKEGNA